VVVYAGDTGEMGVMISVGFAKEIGFLGVTTVGIV
jgi:hypothetical protein